VGSSLLPALPQILLKSEAPGLERSWTPQRDLLASPPDALDFVVETESNRRAVLRFGDGQHGLRPHPGETFSGTYRIGNGTQGNIGAESIEHLVSTDPAIRRVRNPMPASGGVDPESLEHVRRFAPFAFRIQERAVTQDDYAAAAQRSPAIARAAATFRWTGSWQTVFVTAERGDGMAVDAAFAADLEQRREPFRLAGHDLGCRNPP
jgi:predicted phage baseplate assembly protein